MASYQHNGPIRIYNIVDLAAKHQNATHGYELILRGMMDGMGEESEL